MTLEATPDVTTAVAPGWYTDPANEDSQRWWDGDQWTEHVSVAIAGGPDLDLSPAGVAPVQEFTPLQPLTLTGPASQFHSNTHHSQLTIDRVPQVPTSNRPAWASLVLGVIAAGIAIVGLDASIGTPIVAVTGVGAMVLAIVALRRTSKGTSTNAIAPVIGLILGLVGCGVMAFNLYTAYVAPSTGATGTVNAPIDASQKDSATNADDAGATHARAVLTSDVKKINSAMKSAKGKSPLWPASIIVDPKKGVIVTGTGKKLGIVPVGTVVSYSTSVDGTSYTLTVSNPSANVGIRYSSATFEMTSF